MPVETIVRRSRGLADIAPQYIAKSGLCAATEMESARGGSIRIQHLTATASEGRSRFPKLDECAHFHYEQVELGPFQVALYEEELKPLWSEDSENKWWHVSVTSQGKSWVLRRSYDNFRMLDQQLHRCIYDRKFSGLLELPPEDNVPGSNQEESIRNLLTEYLLRFSQLAGNAINCGPVLNWLELDNRGRRLLVPDGDNCPINTPAVAAAYAVRRYQAQAGDEISFEVGDMISVIDMPPPEESVWWRGKRGFLVGFFPSECVAVIGDKVPRSLAIPTPGALQPSKPVLRKHGKLIAFFRSFILARPSRRRLRQSGILKERVFGCDLGEHLLNSGHDIPMVLKCCAEFIETNGIVDGIYRLSGVTSNIQKLRNAFDEDRVPALYEDEAILQDIHSVASLLKMYFRELPNPLCTYQLYHTFVGAVQGGVDESGRLVRMRDAVHKLPPPHYRTLQYLVRHLAKVASRGHLTGMTPRNVAIVWAPNLLRCKELEVGGVAALQGVGVQAVVTEFLVCYADLIFCDRLTHQPSLQAPSDVFDSVSRRSRPKSLAISTPTKLLSLEEARSRALMSSGKAEQEYIEVGGGPANLPAKYHTIIELPGGGSARKRGSSKRSPLGWKSFFSKSGRKNCSVQRKTSTPSELGLNQEKAVTESEVTGVLHRRLRPVKSAESLTNCAAHDVTSDMGTVGDDSISGNGVRSGGHSRSVSHDSYFDQTPAHTNTHASNRPQRLQEEDNEDNLSSSLDLSEIQLNFDLEETEMRIFSEDETLMSVGSGSLGSPRVWASLRRGVGRMEPSPKRVQRPLGSTSPRSKRSRLEQRLACSPADLRYIDSQSPDNSAQVVVQAEVYPTASSSPHEENLLSSGLTTPDTPLPTYAPLLEADSSAVTTPDYENLAGCSSLTPSPTLCITIKYGNVVRTSGLYQDMAGNTYQEMAPNNLPLKSDYQNITTNEGSAIYQNVSTEETICESLNCKFYQNVPQDQNYETVTSQNKATESLTPSNSYETLNSTKLISLSEDNTPKTAFYQNFTDTVAYQNLSGNTDDDNVYEDVQPKTETELYQQVKIFRNSVNEVNRLLEESGDSSAGESSNGVEDAENKTMLSDVSLETSFDEEVQTKILKTNLGSFDNIQKHLIGSPTKIESKENIIEKCDITNETMHEIEKLSVNDDSDNTDNDFVKILESNSNSETQHTTELNSSDCLDIESQLCMKEIHSVTEENAFHDRLNLNLLSNKSNEIDCTTLEHFEETCNNIPESIELPFQNKKFNEILSEEEKDAFIKSGKSSISFNNKQHIFEQQIFHTDPVNQKLLVEDLKSAVTEHCSNDSKIANDKLESSSLTIASVSNNIRLHSKSDYSPPSDSSRRRFESEIGREILRERRMKQELEEIRTASMASTSCENPKTNIKSLLNRFEHSASLPPCVRARVAKTARNKLSSSLSVSLDEDQFPTSYKKGLVRVSTSPDVNTEREQGAQQQQYHHQQEESPKVNESINFDDPQRRERIERYKEERRTFLREKYRSESFRGERDDILHRLKQKTGKLSTSPTDESHTVDRIKSITRNKRENSVPNETVERKSKLEDGIKCKQGNALRKYSEEKSPRSIRHRLSLDHKSPREGWGDEIKSDNIPIFESRVSFMSEDSSDRTTKCLVADQCASDSSIKRRLTSKVGGEESMFNTDTSPDRKCLTRGASIDTKLVIDTDLHKQKAKVADKRFGTQEMNAETLIPNVNVNSLETRPNSVDFTVDVCRISKVGSLEKSTSEEAVKLSSPRRQIASSQAPITPTSIRDIAALFENRDNTGANSTPSRPGKQYMSSV